MDKTENTSNKGTLTKVLAIIGTILLWAPIAFMLLTSIVGSLVSQHFRMDYLIPAELFPVVILGGLLLLGASLRAKLMRKTIIIELVAAVVFLFAGQGIAVLSGIASGAAAATGLYWWLVIASLVIYDLAVLGLAIGGTLLIRRLRKEKS